MMKGEMEIIAEIRDVSGDPIRCPDCGESMVEMDRVIEKGFEFVWYYCSRDSCHEQWLEKKPSIHRNLFDHNMDGK